MDKNIQELHKLIIGAGRSGDATKLKISEISNYHHLATELLLRPLPVGKENRCDFLKGLILLENSLRLGSTSQIWKFMKRLDLYNDTELMDWIFANRNNPYIPFGSFRPPLEVRSYSQYIEYDKKRQEHREKMIGLDIERSRTAKERKDRIKEEHAARKKPTTKNAGTKAKMKTNWPTNPSSRTQSVHCGARKLGGSMTYKYTFEGVIHPKRVKFSVNAKFGLQIKQPGFGIDGAFGIEFKDSDFTAGYASTVDHTKRENANLETLRNYIEEAIWLIVDTYCYVKSYSYEVEIIKVECPELKVNYTFDVQGEKNINKDKKQTDDEFTNFMMFFAMRPDLDFLRHALADFRRSIKYPVETAAFCFRAIETIRRFYFEDMEIEDGNERREKGWQELRTVLNFDRYFFEDIEKFALPNRHGEYPVITYQKREVIMNKTRQVVDTFIKHVNEKQVDDVRLPDGRKEGKVNRIW